MYDHYVHDEVDEAFAEQRRTLEAKRKRIWWLRVVTRFTVGVVFGWLAVWFVLDGDETILVVLMGALSLLELGEGVSLIRRGPEERPS